MSDDKEKLYSVEECKVTITYKRDKLIKEAQRLFQECVDQENYIDTPWFKEVIDWLNKTK